METPRSIPGGLWIVQLAEVISSRISGHVKDWPYSDQFGLGNQITRAADSIGLNLSEGYARYHGKDRLRFFDIAEGSLEETLFAVRRARDRQLISGLDASILSGLLIRLSTAIDALKRKLQQ